MTEQPGTGVDPSDSQTTPEDRFLLGSRRAVEALALAVDELAAIVPDARLKGKGQDLVMEHLLAISGGDLLNIDRKFLESWNGRL